jgi:hypothetical protein
MMHMTHIIIMKAGIGYTTEEISVRRASASKLALFACRYLPV